MNLSIAFRKTLRVAGCGSDSGLPGIVGGGFSADHSAIAAAAVAIAVVLVDIVLVLVLDLWVILNGIRPGFNPTYPLHYSMAAWCINQFGIAPLLFALFGWVIVL